MKKNLSIIMPAYNEGDRLEQNIREALASVQPFVDHLQLVVVDDGSEDDTFAIAKQMMDEDNRVLAIRLPVNSGKGEALRVGVNEADDSEYIAFCDADLDIHPVQLKRFIRLMDEEDADVVIGSKFHPDSNVEYPVHRRLYSFGYYLLLLVMFRLNTRDTQTGLKLFRSKTLKPVMKKILVKRFAYDIEILSVINRQKGKIASAPVDVVLSEKLRGITIKDVKDTFIDTLAIFYRMYLKHYYD